MGPTLIDYKLFLKLYLGNDMPTRKWINENKVRYLETSRVKSARHSRTLKGKYTRHKATAKLRRLDNTVSFEEFCMLIAENKCHWCSGMLPETRGGLDRINNSLPYTFENCVPCCSWCNRAKGTLTASEFIEKCRQVFNSSKNEQGEI